MLRLRSAALARSKLAALPRAAAAGESCTCSAVPPLARRPVLARRLATTAATRQRRWFSVPCSDGGGARSSQPRREKPSSKDPSTDLKASLAQLHEMPDSTVGVEEFSQRPSFASDSLQGAAGVVKNVLETQDIPVKSLQPEIESTSKRKRGRKPGGTAKPKQAAAAKKGNGAASAKAGKSKDGEAGAAAATATPKKRKAKAPKEDLEVHTVTAPSLKLSALPQPADGVPRLSYELDRTLFKPGVYPMQDPRTRVFNFDPYLATIMPINEFDFGALKAFVSSSEDTALMDLAAKSNKKYSGSTSSMSTMLSHFHYLLSAWRPINPAQTSRAFTPESTNFTQLLRAPAATFLHYKDGIYAVDADKQFDTANILSMLGKSMEKLLTLPKEEYEMYRRSKSDQLTEEQRNSEEAYHYTTMGDFILRSQLDAHDPRLPGAGMFDIKTRAVLAIRMDARDYHKGLGYEIRYKFGQFESFEREYFDMIRSAFLKYSLQVRMGRMDGIFVAFHNTRRIFGFQYIPLEEMDLALHGTKDTALGDQEFKLSLHLLNQLFNRATERFPKRPLRIHVETRPTNPPLLYFFAKPVTDEQIHRAQSVPRAEIDKFEKAMMGFAETEADVEEQQEEAQDAACAGEDESSRYSSDGLSLAVWTEMNQKAEEAVKSDELGIGYVRRNIEEALEQSGLLEGKTTEEAYAYVNTLLETLIVGEGEYDASAETPGAPEQQQQQQGVEENVDEGGEKAKSPPCESASEDESGSLTVDETGSLSADGPEVVQSALDEGALDESSAGLPDEANAAETSADDDNDGAQPRDVSASSTLKDLIIRLAEQVDDRPPPDDEALEEKPSKLQRFEQVLSQLMAESRVEQSSGPTLEEAATAASASAAAAESWWDDAPEWVTSGDGASGGPAGPTAAGTAGEAGAEAGAGAAPLQQPNGPVDDDIFDDDDDELLGMILTVRNKLDGKYVTRPHFTADDHRWSVEYSIQTMGPDRAKKLYNQVKTRRKGILDQSEDRNRQWHSMFGKALPRLSDQGRRFRRKEDDESKGRPVWVVGKEEKMEWDEVFGDEK